MHVHVFMSSCACKYPQVCVEECCCIPKRMCVYEAGHTLTLDF